MSIFTQWIEIEWKQIVSPRCVFWCFLGVRAVIEIHTHSGANPLQQEGAGSCWDDYLFMRFILPRVSSGRFLLHIKAAEPEGRAHTASLRSAAPLSSSLRLQAAPTGLKESELEEHTSSSFLGGITVLQRRGSTKRERKHLFFFCFCLQEGGKCARSDASNAPRSLLKQVHEEEKDLHQ